MMLAIAAKVANDSVCSKCNPDPQMEIVSYGDWMFVWYCNPCGKVASTEAGNPLCPECGNEEPTRRVGRRQYNHEGLNYLGWEFKLEDSKKTEPEINDLGSYRGFFYEQAPNWDSEDGDCHDVL